MIVLNLTRGNSPLRVPLHLPATPADIGVAYAKLDTISTDDRETHIGSAITGIGALDRWLRDRPMDRPGDYVELGELAERIDRLDEKQRKTFGGALTGAAFSSVTDALRIACSLDDYIFINGVTTEKELGRFLVDSGYKGFPESVKPYLDYAAIGIEYHAEHDGAFTGDGYARIRRYSPGRWRTAKPRRAPRSGNLTPPRISPSCPHCLNPATQSSQELWLGRGTIVGK